MKIYILADMEGISGIRMIEQVQANSAEYLPACKLMMPSLDESVSGLVLLGHHARAGTLNGFLDHTVSSASWFEFRVNDQVIGEIGIEAAYAAHFGVPVIAVSGDEATAAEAKALLGEVECAVVKRGIGRNRAHCLSITEAHKRIRIASLKEIGVL